MQEIKKRRIVLASVLKPVDEPRMFSKIGRSLATFHDVHVIGSGRTRNTGSPPIQIHPLGIFPRISLTRLIMPWKILSQIITLKPELLIVCTHELLLQGMIARIVCGCRLWYDVQENYALNIRSTETFPRLARPLVAGYVRAKERLLGKFVERYLLAEECYLAEMPYLRSKATVIENKHRRSDIPAYNSRVPIGEKETIQLLFNGTLSETTGVFVAIRIASALRDLDPRIRLKIVGHCPQESVWIKLTEFCKDKLFVSLKGGTVPVPHREILDEIGAADAAIISYPHNPSTWNAVPTKLYEYLASRLPIILIENPKWVRLAAKYQAAVVFHSDRFNAPSLLKALTESRFYCTDPQDVYWESEEEKLLSLI